MRQRPPSFPIKPVLEALGFEDVPDVRHGHRKIRCFFHGDRNPSASVSRYGFVCYACGRTGDAIKLAREEWGLDFEDAVRKCAALTGITDSGGGSEPGWGDGVLI